MYSYLNNIHYSLKSIPITTIDSIKRISFSIVDEIIKEKVYKEKIIHDQFSTFYDYYSQNNNYILYVGYNNKEYILDTLEKVYSFIPTYNGLFAFETYNKFRYFELFQSTVFRSLEHVIPIQQNNDKILVKHLTNDLSYIEYYHFHSKAIFPYLIYDDVLINDFDSFINTYRKPKK